MLMQVAGSSPSEDKELDGEFSADEDATHSCECQHGVIQRKKKINCSKPEHVWGPLARGLASHQSVTWGKSSPRPDTWLAVAGDPLPAEALGKYDPPDGSRPPMTGGQPCRCA